MVLFQFQTDELIMNSLNDYVQNQFSVVQDLKIECDIYVSLIKDKVSRLVDVASFPWGHVRVTE